MIKLSQFLFLTFIFINTNANRDRLILQFFTGRAADQEKYSVSFITKTKDSSERVIESKLVETEVVLNTLQEGCGRFDLSHLLPEIPTGGTFELKSIVITRTNGAPFKRENKNTYEPMTHATIVLGLLGISVHENQQQTSWRNPQDIRRRHTLQSIHSQ